MPTTIAVLILCIFTVVINCLSYVTIGSTVKKPEGTCCSGLKSVLRTDALCLCEAFKNSAQLGTSLNATKSLALPYLRSSLVNHLLSSGFNSEFKERFWGTPWLNCNLF
ncbi:unnamed protein product [Lactuca virosa]|uniref:Bifunctional inhibitor/plant lipid transfer protein/seed storage helical domain-containing protein n=1 Tax=Lactuca virosa TaxID=75947 RepID=A0AAU9NDX1_9ASTR|nr:unnamed protein product [Lactuca virosa]